MYVHLSGSQNQPTDQQQSATIRYSLGGLAGRGQCVRTNFDSTDGTRLFLFGLFSYPFRLSICRTVVIFLEYRFFVVIHGKRHFLQHHKQNILNSDALGMKILTGFFCFNFLILSDYVSEWTTAYRNFKLNLIKLIMFG